MNDPAAAAWEAEYARGRYLEDAPVDFVSDIVGAWHSYGSEAGRGIYLGCGNGRNFVPLLRAGLDLDGLDISPTALEPLNGRLSAWPRSRLFVGSIGDFRSPIPYAIVIGIQVLQHGRQFEARANILAAQAMSAPGGLFCLRVNATATDLGNEHERVEQDESGSFTVRYLAGPKAGLPVHFFSGGELSRLFDDGFEVVLPLRLSVTERTAPATGRWSQWEAIWRRRPT